jgi:hypothetical protein
VLDFDDAALLIFDEMVVFVVELFDVVVTDDVAVLDVAVPHMAPVNRGISAVAPFLFLVTPKVTAGPVEYCYSNLRMLRCKGCCSLR